MKPILLEIEGFNSFEKKQVIDFQKLTSLGLFGIFGNTGSGKTTILDAIIYALYEKTPRESDNIVNVNSKKAIITYKFEIKGSSSGTYEIQRTLSVGKTISKKAKLTRIDNDSSTVLADKKTEVDEKVQEIIGLGYSDFIKTVVLPQGEFSSFLKEKNKNRKEMLERLFSLQKYGEELSAKISKYKAKYQEFQKDYNKELIGYNNIDENSIQNLQTQLDTINKEIKLLNEEYGILNELHQEHKLLEKYELEYKDDNEKYNLLLEEEKEIAEEKQQVQLLQKLTILQETIKNYKNINENLPFLEKNQEIINLKIQKFEQDKNEKKQEELKIKSQIEQIPILQKEIEDMSLAVDVVKNFTLLKQQELEISKKQEELLKEQLLQHTLQETNTQKINELKENITKIDEYTKNNTYKSEYKQDIRLADSYNKEIQKISKELSTIEDDNVNISSKLKENEDILKNLQNIEKALLKEIQNTSKNTDDEKYTQEEYLKKESLFFKTQTIKSNLENYEQHLQELEKELSKTLEKQKTLEQLNLEKTQEKEQLEKKLNQIKKQNIIQEITKNLNDGDICPVCKGTYHISKKQIEEISSYDIDSKDIQELEKQLYTLGQDLAILKNTSLKLQQEIEKTQTNIKYTKDETNIKDIGQADEIITQCLSYKEQYTQYIRTKQELLDTIKKQETELNDTKTNIVLSQNNIKNLKDNFNINQTKINKLSETKKEIILKLDMLSKKLNIEKEDFEHKLDQIVSSEQIVEKNNDILSSERKKLQELEQENQKITNILNQLTNIQNELKISSEKIKSQKEFELSKVQDKNLLKNQNLPQEIIIAKNNIQEIQTKEQILKQNLDEIEKNILNLNIELTKITTNLEIHKKNLSQSTQTLQKFVDDNRLTDINYIFEINKDYEKLDIKKLKIENFEKELKEKQLKKELSQKQIAFQKEKLQNLEKNKSYDEQRYNQLRELILEKQKTYGSIENKLYLEKDIFKKKKELILKSSENQTILDEVNQIESLFKGKAFVQFLAKHQLSYVCKKASEILTNISAGRFNIDINEDGDFIILDYKNGGIMRNPSTLSGGETFLVSLALALALSSQIQLKGNAPLEFFFMDEGFGTLDSDTLDIALNCLKSLKNENLSIGIISHIDKIKQAVPIKLEIKKDDILGTSSTIKIVTG